jgi:LysM repeat protein
LLPGCIPTAGQDYRIASSTNSAPYASDPAEPLAEPVIVPEREIVAQTPSWSPAAVNRNARQVEAQSYIVKGGDTLFGIAAATGAGATAIAEANALTPPYMLKTGQRLQIPAGRFHRVGDCARLWHQLARCGRAQPHPATLYAADRTESAIARW